MRKILLLTTLLSIAFGQQIPQVTPYEKKPLKNKFITIKKIEATGKKNTFDFIIDVRVGNTRNRYKVKDEIKYNVKLFQEKNGLEGYGYVISNTDCIKVKFFSAYYADGEPCGTIKRRYHFAKGERLLELREFFKD